MRRFILIPLLLVIVGGSIVLGYQYFMKSAQGTPAGAAIGGDFTLSDLVGKPVTNDDFKGSYRLVYFGFTTCPAICPTGLNSMGAALADLGQDAQKIVPMFITFDPERDTPERLREYMSNFDPRFVALTGTNEQIKAAAAVYKVYYAKVENAKSPKDYMMDHSSYVYLMDQDGRYLAHFSSNTPVPDMVKTLRAYVK